MSAPSTEPTMPFDLLGPLPQGTTVLEASAGTGKTFTIAALVARYVAEGVATMDQLLVVSFSRESSRELRERVRERLVSARDGLAEPAGVPDDVLLAFLAQDGPAVVAERRRRLEQALAGFDAATVTTTHGFCQQVMTALGTAGDSDPGAVLMEDLTDLVTEVADDLYVGKWGRPGADPALLTRRELGDLASAVARDPGSPLLPDGDVDGLPGVRVDVATAVRDHVEARKRRQHRISYDDMLQRLADTLSDPDTGPDARARLRERYRVVLVDEFQDTDPVQWAILRTAFAGHRTMVLIGDPKQAIYGFRGADVHAYLDAVRSAASRHTLPTNWRSDAALLDGMSGVLGGAALGDPRIRVLPVTARHAGRMVDVPAPVRLRVLPREELPLVGNGTVSAPAARGAVARDVARQAVALVSGAATLRPREPTGIRAGATGRAVQPGDIAVLVRTNAEAQLVHKELRAAAVPAVVTGRSSVFATPAASEWQLLLEALEQPHRTLRVRRLALGCFVGLDAATLEQRGDPYADELSLRVRGWATVLQERGVAALFEAVSLSQDLPRRVLGEDAGERLLTDLRHLAQLLHEAALAERLGLGALLTWLRRRRAEAGRGGAQERSRRLETDATAVQVITVHTSKGLEFPVVMVPFAWSFWPGKAPATASFHDEDGRRVRDVGGPGSPGWDAHLRASRQEEADDELRLAYVALTRAQSHLLLWWAPTSNTRQSPLHRLLLQEDPRGLPPLSVDVPDDAAALAAFRARAAGTAGTMVVERIERGPAAVWASPVLPAPALSLPAFVRPLDTSWRRTSYTALTSLAHGSALRLGSEPETAQRDDENDLADVDAPGPAPPGDPAGNPPGDEVLRSTSSAWDPLPAGSSFGTLVHAVLERLDSPDDPAAVRDAVAEEVARTDPVTDVGALAEALQLALATPLGPLADGAALRDLTPGDRLAELEFELPLAGGDEPREARVLLPDLVPLWREHCPPGPLSGYPDALAALPAEAPLRGYLTGSIDAVLRVGSAGQRRYLVVDYKTNRLAGPAEPLTAWHYRQAALEAAMVDAHYPLQALLYQVALHRYLRWRLPGYDAAEHLGGALYLFLRGMSGPGVADPGAGAAGAARRAPGVPGVFAWRPPVDLVCATSDLLAGLR